MVSIPYATLILSSLVITIACTTTCIIRINSAPDTTPREAWGLQDFFSKNNKLPTPSSSQLQTPTTPFPIPDQASGTSTSIFSASVSLAYTFSLLISSLVSSSNAVSIANQMISDLKQTSSVNPNATMYWPSVVNISTSFFSSQNFLSGAVTGNSSDPSSYSTPSSQQIEFLERSLGLDNVPVLMLLQAQNDCSWVVCVGYNSDSFFIVDPFVSSSSANHMDAPKWVQRSSIYNRWSCSNAGKIYYQLALAIKKTRA